MLLAFLPPEEEYDGSIALIPLNGKGNLYAALRKPVNINGSLTREQKASPKLPFNIIMYTRLTLFRPFLGSWSKGR